VHDTIQAGADAGQSVKENDGTAIATDPNGFGPFSIAQWIAQRNGIHDRRHGAVLTSIDGISPFGNGDPATGNLNTSFPITRDVYNVLPYDRVVNTGDGNFDPALAGIFAGTGSSVCQADLTIQQYGFATIPNCGDTSLRAFANG
jgi:hypothetical protein